MNRVWKYVPQGLNVHVQVVPGRKKNVNKISMMWMPQRCFDEVVSILHLWDLWWRWWRWGWLGETLGCTFDGSFISWSQSFWKVQILCEYSPVYPIGLQHPCVGNTYDTILKFSYIRKEKVTVKKRNLKPTCDFFVLPNICCPPSLGCHNVPGSDHTRFWDGQGLLWNLGFQQTKVFTCAWSSRLSWAHIGGSCQIPSPREVAGTVVEKSFQKHLLFGFLHLYRGLPVELTWK